MAELGRGTFKLETDSSGFNTGIDAAEQKTGKLGGAMGKLGAVGRVMGGVVAGTVVGALSDFANAAAEDEANALKLQVAIENSGVSWGDYADEIDDAIAKGQALAFSDDATRNSLASLTESTGSVEEAMKRLPIAMDLARAKNISLEAASKLLGKVSDENTTALKKYGIVMDEGATATDVLAKVQQVAGGQAEAYGSTTSASIAKVKDQIGEMTESIGASLGPFQGLIAMAPGLKDGMSLAGGAIGLLTKNTQVMTLVKSASIPVINAVKVAMSLMLGPIGLIVLAVGALYVAWTTNFGGIQEKTAEVIGVVTGVFDTFGGFFKGLWDSLPGPVQAAIGLITAPIQALIALVQAAIGWLQSLGVAQATYKASGPSTTFSPSRQGGEVFAASGFEGMVTRPTTFHVAENFKQEYVRVSPMSGGGRGGDAQVIQLVVDSRVLAQVVNDANTRKLGDIGRSIR